MNAARTREQLQSDWTVYEPGCWESEEGPSADKWPTGWWAYANDDGIVAYFGNEDAAWAHKKAEIDRELHGALSMKARIIWTDGDAPDDVEILAVHFPSKSLWVKYLTERSFAPMTFHVALFGDHFLDTAGNTCRITTRD